MIRALEDAKAGVRGVFALLAFRDGWRSHFDVSAEGVTRSFAGVVLALPAYVFLIVSANHFVAENPDLVSADASVTLLSAAISWARFWLLFPILAAGMVWLLGAKDRYAPWLVVHNWTVFVLVHVQALIWALYGAGLADPAALAALVSLYQFLRLFIHWRVAHGALGLPPGLAAAAAGVPLVIDWMILSALG